MRVRASQGYTLIELLITVAILGVLATLGVPMYRGYIDASTVNTVQNNLRAIHLQQREFLSDNGVYYSSGAACGQHAAAINNNLFGGQQVLSVDDGYDYCILQVTTADFVAHAQEQPGGQGRDFTINELNVDNF